VTKHLLRDLEHLKKMILGVGAKVEDSIHIATTALLDRRPELARQVIAGDRDIDSTEVEIEEECLKILALHQPVAFDLRYIVAVLKLNNDLERMGDLAVNIAQRAICLSEHPALPTPAGFDLMVTKVRSMVGDSLNALVEHDTDLALAVLRADDDVDTIHRTMFTHLQDLMRQSPDNIERATHMLSVSRNLERIADQATNIAEDVLFMVTGEIVRHQGP